MLPTGTVTFLFTDIQGSTPLWEREPEKMAAALQIHNAALREAIESHGGVVFKTVGDAFQAAFPTAPQALKAAIEGQRALSGATWNELGELQVRMGLHTGEAEPDPGGDEYAVSHTKNRVARIMSAAHGGQILLSAEAAELINRQLPLEINLKDLGAHHLKGLLHPEHLHQVVVPGLPAEFPPLASESRPNHNLPLELTSFIGRQREIALVQALLREQRLVTLTGSGGVGKTRLSIQAAGGMPAEFPDGARYVELAPISDPDLVPQTVAAALSLREEPNRPIMDTLSSFLSKRELLLVLDNCEHVLEACARLANALLRQAPGLRILTSSREALGIAGENLFHVPSLAVPDSRQMPSLEVLREYEAVRLFTERARAVLPAFEVNEHNAQTVAQICQRLDGIPLALELAAARMKVLTPAQIADRLDDRFRLLTGGSRVALPRQQTLRALVDWSWELLSDAEQLLLQRLSVFVGGITLEAVETVCSGDGLEPYECLDLLHELVNKSLLIAKREQGQETHYHLLETIRQYAQEKLAVSGSTETFQQRHLTYFRQFAETAAPFLKGPDLLIWLYRLEESLDNIRVALDWAQKADVGNGLRLIFALSEFCWVRGNIREMEARLGQFLAQTASVSPLVKANGIWLQGWFSAILDHYDKAIVLLEKSLNLYRELEDQAGVASALHEIGHALHVRGEIEKGHVALQEAITLHRSLGDTVGTAWSLMALGEGEMELDHYEQAWECFQESVSLFREAGNLSRFHMALLRSGLLATQQQDFDAALSFIRESLSIVELLGVRGYLAYFLQYLGKLYFQLGDYPSAQTTFDKSLLISKETESYAFSYDWTFVQLGYAHLRGGNLDQAKEIFSKSQQQFKKSNDTIGIIYALEGLASLAVQQEQPETAVRLFAWADMTRHLNKNDRAQSEQTDVDRDMARLLEMIDKEAYAAAYAAGQAMTMAQAVAHALGDED